MKYILHIIIFSLLFANDIASAVNRISNVASGNWATAASWLPVGVPTAADNITIRVGHTITMNGNTGACLSLTINGIARWIQNRTTNVGIGGVNITATGDITGIVNSTLTSAGGLQLNAVLTSNSIRIRIQTNNGQSISGTGSLARLIVNRTATNIGNITVRTALAGSSTLTNGVNATLNIGRTSTISGLNATAIPNLVNYNGTANQTIKTTTYYNLLITKTAGTTANFGGTLNINNDFTVISGTASVGGITFTVLGNTTLSDRLNITSTTGTKNFNSIIINSGGVMNCSAAETITLTGNLTLSGGQITGTATGIYNVAGTFDVTSASTLDRAALNVTGISTLTDVLSITSISGAKTFGNVVISNTGGWNSTVNENYTISGNLQVDGSFTSGTGTYTFTGASKIISGLAAFSIGTAAISGSYTNTANLSVVTALTGAGSFTQGVNGVLNISATVVNFSVITFNASGANNTVNYNLNGAQNVRNPVNGSYRNLALSVGGTKSLLASTIVIGNTTISAATLDVSASNFPLSVTGNWTNSLGTFNPRNGTVTFNGTGTQTITKAAGETFYNLICAGTSTVLLAGNITVGNSISINSGTLDVSASNYSISVGRNWANSATFNPRSGNVTFNGNVPQQISGSTAWYAVTISNTAGGVGINSGTHTLSNALNFTTAAVFVAGSNLLTLVSDASATARIGQLPSGASITGSIIVQRYVSSRNANYADLSSPVQNESIAGWDTRPNGSNEIYMSGVGGPDGGAFGPGYSVYNWSEPTVAFVPVFTQATVLNPGKGFELFLGDDLNMLNALTFDSRGTPNQGTQNLGALGNLSYTGDGYNLVGNPFASYISWNTVLANSSNIDNTYLIFDAASGTYMSYGAGSEIPPHQGFWVHATASPTVLVTETAKTTSTTSVFHKMESSDQLFSLKIHNSNQLVPFSHITKIDINTQSVNDFENGDLPYLKSPEKLAPSITTQSTDGKELCLNRMSINTNTIDIPVNVTVGVDGNYTIEAKNLHNIKDYACAILEDKLLKKCIDLRAVPFYSFESNKEDDSHRFVLHLSKSGNCFSIQSNESYSANNVSILKTNESNLIALKLDVPKKVFVSVYNTLSQKIIDNIEFTAKDETVSINLPSEYKGVYIIVVTIDGQSTTKKFINQ